MAQGHRTGVLSTFGPAWFATVMGTGIVAVAASVLPTLLPTTVSGRAADAAAVATAAAAGLAVTAWVAAVLLLTWVTAATVLHWRRFPVAARGHLHDPVAQHFYGAPPMALMTVGAATSSAGGHVLPDSVALSVHAGCWLVGTVAGVATAFLVPQVARGDRHHADRHHADRHHADRHHADRHHADRHPGAPFGGWLMPVVPPMVSASTGALLVPHAPPGVRPLLLGVCWALFGLAVVAVARVLPVVVGHVLRAGPGPAERVPTLFIVLGPLGQGMTAVHLLAVAGPAVTDDAGTAGAVAWFAAVVATGLGAIALLWAGVAVGAVVRTARVGLPFSLTWWGFTFPVGTLVTGFTGLAPVGVWSVPAVIALVLFGPLVAAWIVVGARTLRLALPTRGSILEVA